MSNLYSDRTPAHLDDDTSGGASTRGGHGARRGNSLWWVIALLVVVLALCTAWLTTPHGDIIGHASRTAGQSVGYNIRSIRLG